MLSGTVSTWQCTLKISYRIHNTPFSSQLTIRPNKLDCFIKQLERHTGENDVLWIRTLVPRCDLLVQYSTYIISIWCYISYWNILLNCFWRLLKDSGSRNNTRLRNLTAKPKKKYFSCFLVKQNFLWKFWFHTTITFASMAKDLTRLSAFTFYCQKHLCSKL